MLSCYLLCNSLQIPFNKHRRRAVDALICIGVKYKETIYFFDIYDISRTTVNGCNSIYEPYLTLLQYGEGVPVTEGRKL